MKFKVKERYKLGTKVASIDYPDILLGVVVGYFKPPHYQDSVFVKRFDRCSGHNGNDNLVDAKNKPIEYSLYDGWYYNYTELVVFEDFEGNV